MSNKDFPLVSVAIPTYMQAQYVPICIDAVWFQDYPNIEIIVVNAASPDNTREVLDEYAEKIKTEQIDFASYFNEKTEEVERTTAPRYPKEGRSLKIIHLDEDPGLSETYNRGVQEASGEFVTTVVSDDVPNPRMISRLAGELMDGADMAYSDVLIVDDLGRVIRKFEYPEYSAKACLADWYLMGASKLWKKNLHEKTGWFSKDYPLTQDYELFLRFAMDGAKIVHVPETLYSVRYHGADRKDGNHSNVREPKILTESKDIAMRARKWLASRE